MKMIRYLRTSLFGISVLVAAACVGTSSSGAVAAPNLEVVENIPFENGANSLFAGHSFFVPVARSFDQIGGRMEFEDHRVQMVFAGGRQGTPASLWSNKKRFNEIDTILQSGSIELFGLAAAGGRGSETEDFAKWVSHALSYNRDTEFLIAQAWTAGGPRTNTQKFDRSIEDQAAILYSSVEKLRRQFPGVTFHYINYGKTASVMKRAYEAGSLDDIETNVSRSERSLFRDRGMGHAGQMMLDVSALYWVHRLYGVEMDDLPSLGYDQDDVTAILFEVAHINPRFD